MPKKQLIYKNQFSLISKKKRRFLYNKGEVVEIRKNKAINVAIVAARQLKDYNSCLGVEINVTFLLVNIKRFTI